MKMNSIESRSPFFPRSKTSQTDVQKARANQALKRNRDQNIKGCKGFNK
jgi:hypothetical protein